jgi:hypothetical protein
MSTRNRTLGGIGLAVALLAMLSVTACDPYMKANTNAPVVVGVIAVDTFYNGQANDTPGCRMPYPEPDHAWANSVFPGLCVPGAFATVCPVMCYPPRMGPGFAPFYMGNLGGSYQTTLIPNTYTYTLPTTYSLDAVPPYVYDLDNDILYDYRQIRVQFNKLMNPASIQPNPLVPEGPSTLEVWRGPVDAEVRLTSEDFTVAYDPNSDTEYWGASLNITFTGGIRANTRYRIYAPVSDQQGNPLTVDVVVNTISAVDPTLLRTK